MRIIGTVTGRLVNTLFISNFQDMAHGHIFVRLLEKRSGAEPVRLAYKDLKGAILTSGRPDHGLRYFMRLQRRFNLSRIAKFPESETRRAHRFHL